MRELKFRAWGASEQSEWEDAMQYSFDIISRDGEIFYGGEAQPNWILMQYTGLLDKNGKEIYEGDICKVFIGETGIGEIIWDNERCGFTLRIDGIGWIIKNDSEVIGNIYENKELIND